MYNIAYFAGKNPTELKNPQPIEVVQDAINNREARKLLFNILKHVTEPIFLPVTNHYLWGTEV